MCVYRKTHIESHCWYRTTSASIYNLFFLDLLIIILISFFPFFFFLKSNLGLYIRSLFPPWEWRHTSYYIQMMHTLRNWQGRLVYRFCLVYCWPRLFYILLKYRKKWKDLETFSPVCAARNVEITRTRSAFPPSFSLYVVVVLYVMTLSIHT